MERRTFRSARFDTTLVVAHGARRATLASRMARAVGRAMGLHERTASVESLESRQLLEGSFDSPLPLPGPDGDGRVVFGGSINPALPSTNNDTYIFTATQDAFVTALADTSNESPASGLDTRIEIFSASRAAITAGNDNGTVTSGFLRDGWAGFVAEAGETYFIRVSSQGTGSGTYTLRMRTTNATFDIGGDVAPPDVTVPSGVAYEDGTPPPLPPNNPRAILGQLGGTNPNINARTRQDEIVYKWTAGGEDFWDSLVILNAQTTAGNLNARVDTHLDIYNEQGQLIVSDEQTGRLNDAFATFKAEPGETYYFRVRSDEVSNANIQLATGPFYLVMDAIATEIDVDVISRRGILQWERYGNFQPPTVPSNPATPAPRHQASLYEFTAQGSGLAFITVIPDAPPLQIPIVDPAVRVYDENGTLLGFNNNYFGRIAQLQLNLVAGRRYFVVADRFDTINDEATNPNAGPWYTVTVEAHYTFSNDPNTPFDDHIGTDETVTGDQERLFGRATALNFGDPFLTLDADGNPLRDRQFRVQTSATGRLWAPGDRDLFQFTAPTDMLDPHAGDNDDAGTSLFVGGIFEEADPETPFPVGSRSLVTWDAADYWYVGPQTPLPDGTPRGFLDNPDTADTDGPVIYAMLDWEPIENGQPQPRRLVIGGDFILSTGSTVMVNLAVWTYNPIAGRWVWSNELADGTDGPVRAIVAYDPPQPQTPPGQPDPPPGIMIGGDFSNIILPAPAPPVESNRIARFSPDDGWEAIEGFDEPNDKVFALHVYDPQDAGAGRPAQDTPPLPEVLDPEDRQLSVFIGGEFEGGIAVYSHRDSGGGPEADVEWVYDGSLTFTEPPPGGQIPRRLAATAPPVVDRLDGPVYALNQVLVPEQGDVPEHLALAIGGEFTGVDLDGTLNSTELDAVNFVLYGAIDPDLDLQDPAYQPDLQWDAPLADDTFDGPIYAMTTWDPPDINGAEIDPFLVIGGEFGGDGYENIFGFNGVGGVLLGEINGPVRALAATADEDEPSIEMELETVQDAQQVLYIGGDFDSADFGNGPVAANRVVQLSAGSYPPGPNNADFFNFFPLNGGVEREDPTVGNPAQVFALTVFDDGNPAQWDRHDRPGSRLAISTTSFIETFTDLVVNVYDSNYALVYTNSSIDEFNQVNPDYRDPAGSKDPSLTGSGGTAVPGIQIWGGETYYVEVLNGGLANSGGPYAVTISLDAGPQDTDGDGTYEDINVVSYSEEGEEGGFNDNQIFFFTNGNGDAQNVYDVTTLNPAHGAIGDARLWRTRPSVGEISEQRQSNGDLGMIHTIGDKDLYSFRAEFTGTAEIRLSTQDMTDTYSEYEFDETGTTVEVTNTKTYSSRFDGALRIFNNDFQQIGYNDDNAAMRLDSPRDRDRANTGGFDNVLYARRDPRVVFDVVAGETYFIQVESGQLYKDGRPAFEVDRERTEVTDQWPGFQTGSYRLLVNAMANQTSGIVNGQPVFDDHSPAIIAGGNTANSDNATVIPLGDDPGSPLTNGRGTASGTILHATAAGLDTDAFRFISPGSGTMTVRIQRAQNSALNVQASVFRSYGALLATAVETTPGTWDISIPNVAKGDDLTLFVAGLGGSQGAYNVSVQVAGFSDDHGDEGKVWRATDIPLIDFQGSASANGRIEYAGDTDLFRFRVTDYDQFQVRVTPNNATMSPRFTVYELHEDGNGEPIFRRIGASGPFLPDRSAQAVVSVAPDRVVDVPDPGTDRVYPYYYVLVEGADPQANFGDYTVTLTFNATDDHPDADIDGDGDYTDSEFPIATNITLDSNTGLGAAGGEIEVPEDSDLLTFIVEASGTLSLTVTAPAGSTLRPRITLLSSSGAVLAQAAGADVVGSSATVSAFVQRASRVFVVIDGFEDDALPNTNTDTTGAWQLSVASPPIDDHANETEWGLATRIFLGADGRGAVASASLSPEADTDLFFFVPIVSGAHSITITPTGSSPNVAARLEVFRESTPGVFTSLGVIDGAAGDPISFDIPSAVVPIKIYLLVSSRDGVVGAADTGTYSVLVVGPTPTNPPPPPDPAFIDPDSPTADFVLNQRNGRGGTLSNLSSPNQQDLGQINVPGDRDLYSFTAQGSGRAFVRISLPSGSLLDATVQIFTRPGGTGDLQPLLVNGQPVFDADGGPGSTAQVDFPVTASTRYFILVDGVGDSTGSYVVEVDTPTQTNRLFFPEGYANENVFEFIPIANPNPFAIDYNVQIRYFNTNLAPIIINSRIGPNTRDGITINEGTNYRTPGLVYNEAYSLVIEWTIPTGVDPATVQPLGATMSHYDFGSSVGDAFTEEVSRTWNFPRVERDPGAALNYILFFNPHDFEAEVQLRVFFNDGTTATLPSQFENSGWRRVGAQRRQGFGIDDVYSVPEFDQRRGVFSVQLVSRPLSTANEAAFEGVVASITAYRVGAGESAFAALGDHTGGSRKGVITNITSGDGVSSDLTLFNPGLATATVTIDATYVRTGIPGFSRTIQIGPGSGVTLTGSQLGIASGQPVGLRYTSSENISVQSYQQQRGDADSSTPSNTVGRRFYFGDAFIDANSAGRLYFETLWLYNAANTANTINVTLLFFSRPTLPTVTIPVTVPANGFHELRLDQRPEILSAGGPVWFAIDVSSSRPFRANLEHYDLFLGGGWAASGVPFGIQTPIAQI